MVAARVPMGENRFDPKAVRRFEHAGWQATASEYDATFRYATNRFVDALLDAAGATAGTHLLDLCCGTGILAAAAAMRGATPTGFDFSEAMLAEARRSHPDLRFDRADAEILTYADASFDAAAANFGMHHIPRPERAAAEVHRVLRPGGRFAFTSWAPPAENIAWRLLFDAIGTHGDPEAAAKTPPSGGGLATPEAALHLMRGAGFTNAGAGLVWREWRLAGAAAMVNAFHRGTVRTAALIAAQPPEAMPAIVTTIERAMAEFRRSDEYTVPIVAILATGTKSPE